MPEHFFTTREILEAAGAELISGSLNDCFSGVSIDSRTVKKGDIFICIKGERFDGHDFIPEAIAKGASGVIFSRYNTVSLGIKSFHNLIAVDNTLSALSDLAYYHRKRFGIPVVGISGSNGKTTTKEMAYSLLSARYEVLKNEGTENNIIGLSLSLLRLNARHDLAVLELGTNHFGEIRELVRIAAPSVGVITNIGPAHLESFDDEKGVLKEKWDLIEELAWPAIAVLNADDPFLREKITLTPEGLTGFTFGLRTKADFRAKKISCRNQKVSFYVHKSALRLNTVFKINVYNALASYALARIFSIDAYDIIKILRAFQFPRARFQMQKIQGLEVIDDAYNANPASLGFALEAFSALSRRGRKILVMGDMLELGHAARPAHARVGVDLSKANIDVIIGIGALSHIACDMAASCGFNAQSIFKCASTYEARKVISNVAKKHDTVLLKGSRAMRLEEIFE